MVGEDAGCFGVGSTSIKVHPDGSEAQRKNWPQSFGKSRRMEHEDPHGFGK